jgi:hypothetical protein
MGKRNDTALGGEDKRSFVNKLARRKGTERDLGSTGYGTLTFGTFPRSTSGRNDLAMNHSVGLASIVEVDVVLSRTERDTQSQPSTYRLSNIDRRTHPGMTDLDDLAVIVACPAH